MEILHRAAPGKGDGLDFVLSDENIGRDGLVVKTRGWDLRNFTANPVALFSHDSRFPIGSWANIRTEGDRLIGTLKLAKKGTSERIDELISLVEQGILRAVSVGFRVLDRDGINITKQELTEASLVSVPALPSALAMARSLDISDATISMAFGEQAVQGEAVARSGATGEHAATPPKRKTQKMERLTLSQRVERAQDELTRSRDTLSDLNDAEPLDLEAIEELHERIDNQERALAALQRSEALLAAKAEPSAALPGVVREQRRPFAVPAEQIKPGTYMLRALATKVVAHVRKQPIDVVRQSLYGEDEGTRAVVEHYQRAASAPATTSTSGWASQLVETVNADFLQSLMPASVYPSLSGYGLRLSFGRAGVISIPRRSATPTVAGSFVLEGSAIPVRQAAFATTTLTPKKMAVISTFTREIAEHSTPAIEGLIRDAIREDTSVAIDTVLLDTTAASTTRPAGILNGTTSITETTGGGFDALVGDIKLMVGELLTATSGNIRSPVWIMNPAQALSASLTQNAGGDFPFAAEISGMRFRGYPLIVSPTVTAGKVILLDAADFVSVTGDEPRFDVSDQATLHMEDTTPTAIGTAGTPNVVAAPVRSLWQTDTIGLRMILPMNWGFTRTGAVSVADAVTW